MSSGINEANRPPQAELPNEGWGNLRQFAQAQEITLREQLAAAEQERDEQRFRVNRQFEINNELRAEIHALQEALSEAESRATAAVAEAERLDSWTGLLELLDRRWPENIFDGSSGDIGPQLTVMARKLATAEIATANATAIISQLEERIDGLKSRLDERTEQVHCLRIRAEDAEQDVVKWKNNYNTCTAKLAEMHEERKHKAQAAAPPPAETESRANQRGKELAAAHRLGIGTLIATPAKLAEWAAAAYGLRLAGGYWWRGQNKEFNHSQYGDYDYEWWSPATDDAQAAEIMRFAVEKVGADAFAQELAKWQPSGTLLITFLATADALARTVAAINCLETFAAQTPPKGNVQ